MRNTSKYSIPKVIISDDGPEFTASTFKIFSKQWDFKHVTSSPHYPKSNKQIGTTIHTVQKSIQKALKGLLSIISHSYFTRPRKQTLHQRHYSTTVQLEP